MLDSGVQHNLPSFKSLQAFEACGRLLSFKQAADELGVTASAISHQLKQLEDRLGKRLLQRHGGSVVLTAAGRQLLPILSTAFSDIGVAIAELGNKGSQVVTLAVYSSFALQWLIPRLPDFRSRHPGIDLRLEMVSSNPDLESGPWDAAITVDADEHEHAHCTFLVGEHLWALCSPELAARIDHSQLPASMFAFPLIDIGRKHVWQRWCDQRGYQLPASTEVHHYSHVILGLQAASDGQGIALIGDFLVRDDVERGRLVHLDLGEDPPDDRYYLCFSREAARRPAYQALRGWLEEKTAAYR